MRPSATSWEAPNWAYEDAACAFASALIEAPATAEFRADIAAFVAGLQPAARLASIAQTVPQLTAPGIPDIYRGTELWDLTLVDPDNRRPVDWEARQAAAATEPPLPRDDDTGASKLHVMRRLLTPRRGQPRCFSKATTAPSTPGPGPAAGSPSNAAPARRRCWSRFPPARSASRRTGWRCRACRPRPGTAPSTTHRSTSMPTASPSSASGPSWWRWGRSEN